MPPPVRWTGSTLISAKTSSASTIIFVIFFIRMSNGESMTADGWKPIVGNVRPSISTSYEYENNNYQDEIKYYQNPILKETVKAEQPETPTTPLDFTTVITTPKTTTKHESRTIKNLPQVSVNIIHHQNRGKIPAHTKHVPHYYVFPNHSGHGPHIPISSVTHGRPSNHKKPQNTHSHKRVKKPVILSAQSTRNEVYVPAPSVTTGNAGKFQFFQTKNVRTRDNSGALGINGGKLFSFKQPNVHVEFSSHYPPNNIFQASIGNQFFQKQQHFNEIFAPSSYQVETSQTLLPPPLLKHGIKHNHNINPEIHSPGDKIIFGHAPHHHHNRGGLILQLPNFEPKNKPITEYPSFKSPTYEVTEPKWEENTPPTVKYHKLAQSVELNLPPFLPTPYKPDNIGTTQNDVSTIYNQLTSTAFKKNPYFFNIKEVSTHYPVIEQQEQTEVPPKRRKKLRTTTTSKPITEDLEEERETTTIHYETTERVQRRPTRPLSSEERPRKRPQNSRRRTRPKVEHVKKEETTTTETLPIIRHFTTIKPTTEEPTTVTSTEIYETPVITDSEEQQSQSILTETNQEEIAAQFEIQKEEEENPDEILAKVVEHFDVTTNELEEEEENEQTTTPTTTTTTTTTVKPRGVPRRPVKYGPSTRPRFSVKEYRQRLNQQSTTSTTEHPVKQENLRVRFPTRRRITTSTTTTAPSTETSTTQHINHRKFTPKDVTRRPYRSKIESTTMSTSTTTASPKVQIKPNLFNRRRPSPVLSLKTRIANKKKSEQTEEPTTVTTTEIDKIDEGFDETTPVTVDIMKNDAIHSQRVSDLTSSLKNDEFEGFKTLASSSRRIPNYYTLSTEDPILPIEAFFSNINNGEQT